MTTPKANTLQETWKTNPRWKGITRPYSAKEVLRLSGTVNIDYTFARLGAERLWQLMNTTSYIHSLGAVTGNQAVQMVQAGLKAIYLSGWQVAGDANTSGHTYPDQSLYPADSVPKLVNRINNALVRSDEIHHMNGNHDTHWLAPIVADAESGFGGTLNAFELMKAMIVAGAAGVHFEDQLSSAKKCGHMGGKVVVPTSAFIRTLVAARLASDIMGTPTLLFARTDAESAQLLQSDIDETDRKYMTGERTSEGFYKISGGLEMAIERGLSYAPYADVIWCETGKPDIDEARQFAEAIHEKFPDKLLAYNCSPSFNWGLHLTPEEIALFQGKLGDLGYKYQFVTLAGFHALNTGMFELASDYRDRGMTAYSELQEKEFSLETKKGYSAIKHQSFVGVKYFDEIQQVIASGQASTIALIGSTEEKQFHEVPVNA